MKDLFLVLIGGLCASFGGFISTLYQAKNARIIRLKQTFGEQQLEVCKEALSLIIQLKGLLVTGTHENGIEFMNKHDEWFSKNRILLPHPFEENWRSIRVQLSQSKRREGIEDKREQFDELADSMDSLANNAEEAIRSELGLPKVNVRGLRKTSKNNK